MPGELRCYDADPDGVEGIVGAWGDFKGLVNELVPTEVGRFSSVLPITAAELAELADQLGIDDLLLAPGERLGSTSVFEDWCEYYIDNPSVLMSMGKMGLSQTIVRLPPQPAAVNLIGASYWVEPNEPNESFLALAMLYDHGDNRSSQQTIGLIARPEGNVEAFQALRFGAETVSYIERTSAPPQTEQFIRRIRAIIDSPLFPRSR